MSSAGKLLSVKSHIITKYSVNCYNIINALVPHLIKQTNSLSLHNNIISKEGTQLSPDSFVGTTACNETCWVLHHMLKNKKIETKLMKKNSDHCFLLYDDKIIIDPTYKQFFTDNVTEENDYTDALFKKYPFVFVGDISVFRNHYNSLNDLHIKNYKKEIETTVSDFWEGYQDHSIKMSANIGYTL